jgi:hypothetical protein
MNIANPTQQPFTFAVNWPEDFDTKISEADTVKEPTIFKFDIDLLAAYFKYLNDEYKGHWMSGFGQFIIESSKILTVPVEDRYVAMAEQVRNYYKAKLVQLSLSGKTLSAFRTKLYQVICNPKEINKEHIGILCRLPDFYQEDVAMDNILEQADSVNPNKMYVASEISDQYEFVGVTQRKIKTGSQQKYWFKNSQNELATLWVELSSPSIPILNMVLKPGKKFNITSLPVLADLRGLTKPVYAIKFVGEYKIEECA